MPSGEWFPSVYTPFFPVAAVLRGAHTLAVHLHESSIDAIYSRALVVAPTDAPASAAPPRAAASLFRAVILTQLGTLASTVLQVVRSMQIAALFGAVSGALDPFNSALLYQTLVQAVIAGALGATFVPQYVQVLGLKTLAEQDRAAHLLGNILGWGIAITALACAALYAGAGPLLRLTYSSVATPEKLAAFHEGIHLLRHLVLMLAAISVAELLVAFYTARQRFFVPALIPVANVAASICWLSLFKDQGTTALADSQTAGAVVQVLVLAALAPRAGGFLPLPRWPRLTPEAKRVLLLTLPVSLSMLAGNANLLIEARIANSISEGTLSVLKYASGYHDIVQKLLVANVGAVFLPFLATHLATNSHGEFRRTVHFSVRATWLVLVPVGVLIWFHAAQVISAVFQRGAFTQHDSLATGAVWAVFGATLPVVAASMFLSRGSLVAGQRRVLYATSALSVMLTLALNPLLARWLGLGAGGIALARGLVYGANGLLIALALRQYYRAHGAPRARFSPAWRTLAALAVFAAAAWVAVRAAGPWAQVPAAHTTASRCRLLAMVALQCAAPLAVYAGALGLFRVHEASALAATALKRRKPPAGGAAVPGGAPTVRDEIS